MILTYPSYVALTLVELGVDPLTGTYSFNGTTLTVEGKSDSEIATAESAITIPDPLDTAKAVRIAVMVTAYDAATAAGFTTNSILMQTDLNRIERLKSGYDLAILESEATMDIISLDNTITSAVAVATVLTMVRELGVNARTLLFQFHARRNSINAAANIAAVNAIDW